MLQLEMLWYLPKTPSVGGGQIGCPRDGIQSGYIEQHSINFEQMKKLNYVDLEFRI